MNILRVVVDNSAELLATGSFGAGALIRVEYSTDSGANYSALTTAALVSGTTIYTVYHQAGTTTTVYRSRYSDSGGTLFSEYSDPFSATTLPQDYTTLPAVKNRIGITDTTDDGLLETLVSETNSWLEGEIGFPVGPITSVARTFDADRVICDSRGRSVLRVYPWGCRAITVVTTTDGTDGTVTTRTASDVVIRPHDHERETGWPGFDLVVKDSASWRWPQTGMDVISVTATWGWASIPVELRSIATRVAIAAFRARGAGSGRTFAIGEDITSVASEELSAADWWTVGKYHSLTLAKTDG